MADERRPWVLDPVFVDRSEPRTAFAKTLVARQPWAVRLNGAEFAALADAAPEDAALKRYVLDHLGVIALTGATDVVTDGSLMKGVRFFGDGTRTVSLVMQTHPHRIRFVDSIHLAENADRGVKIRF